MVVSGGQARGRRLEKSRSAVGGLGLLWRCACRRAAVAVTAQRQVHLPGVIGKAVRPSGIGAAAVRLLGRRKVAAFAAAVRRRSCRGVGLARARLPRHFLEL